MSTSDAGRSDGRPRRRRWIGWSIVVVVMIVVAALIWVGVRGALAAVQLREALPAATELQSAVTGGDTDAAQTAAAEFRRGADRASDLTAGPVWTALQITPWLGPNLKAVRALARSAASVADHSLDPLVSLTGSVDPGGFTPDDGAVDLAPLARAAPALAKANAGVQAAARISDRAPESGLISPLAQAMSEYRGKLGRLALYTDASSRAAALLPAMLGDAGTRHYLVLLLNNAELRSTGGIVGSVAHITVDNGKITLDRVVSDSEAGLPSYSKPVVPLEPATASLFTDITGEYVQDVTLTPHFDQSARLAVAMWQRTYHQSVDGVISLDAVALKYILQATGPVTVSAAPGVSAELDSSNAVPTLLSGVYAKYPDITLQDQFFAAASDAIFDKLAGGDVDAKALLTAFSRIGTERRLNVWSAHAREQTSLARTTLAGGPPTSTAGQRRFGVYLADGTGAKMDYYLHTSLALGRQNCSATGAAYTVQVTLRNDVSSSQLATLSPHVTGGGHFGVRAGTIRTQVSVYAAEDVRFARAIGDDGAPLTVKFVRDHGRDVAQYVVDLKPGEARTATLIFTPERGVSGTIGADATPQANDVPITAGHVACATIAH